MKLAPKAVLAISTSVGSVLQLAGLGWCFRSGSPEVNLFVGLLLFAVGTPLSVLGIERYALSLGRRDWWALTGLIGPIGALIVTRLTPGTTAARVESAKPRSAVNRWVALALTGVIALGWLWAARVWLQGHEWPRPIPTAEVKQNERLAYERLKLISEAQARFRTRDWDGDGKQTYATFVIHLWQSVDLQGRPVAVDLIPRELGFAMVQPFAVDGYFFQSLYSRAKSADDGADPSGKGGRPGFRDLDPEEEWAVAAIATVPKETGLRVFVADESGAIFTPENAGAWVTVQVSEPAKRGWIEVRSMAHLIEIQAQTTYPAPRSSTLR
jgi:hypothetical protein